MTGPDDDDLDALVIRSEARSEARPLVADNEDLRHLAGPLSPAELEALVEGVLFVLDRLGKDGIEFALRFTGGSFSPRTLLQVIEATKIAGNYGSGGIDIAVRLAKLRKQAKAGA